MTTLLARARKAFAAFAALALLALGATDAQATHFRYGTLRWEVVNQNDLVVNVKITHESAWRFTFAYGATPTVGLPLSINGTSLTVQRLAGPVLYNQPLVVTPSAINLVEDWFVGAGEIQLALNRTDLPVRIFWDSNARISFLADGNDDLPYRVESVMTATPNLASPSASILPIITVAHPLPAAKFFIPAADVEGDALTWSIAPTSRSRLLKARPDGADNNPTPINFDINPATGEVTWDTSQESAPVAGCNPPAVPCTEFFAVQFIVSDSKGGETPVDAFLRLVPNQGTPPQALINGSASQHVVAVRPNNPVSFTFTGLDTDSGATVTLTNGNLPPGATMTPSLPTAGPGNAPGTSSTFNWTPTLGQAGNVFVVQFAVTDNFGIQSSNSAQITVLENFAPAVTCPAPATVEATGPDGATRTVAGLVSDPDGDTLIVRWYVGGVLVHTETLPGPFPAPEMPVELTRLFALGSHAVKIEVDDGQLVRDCTTSVSVVDTTPPVVTVPADITEEAVGPLGNVVTFTATAFDIVDGPLAPSCTPASGSTFPVGSTTVTCTATDAHANTGTASFLVNIVDTTAPVVTVPPDMTLEATGPAGAVATFTATAFDIVDGPLVPTCTPASGSTFPLDATTTVTCSATDSHNNTGTATFTITVVDTTPPDVTVPPNMTVEATGPAGAAVTFSASAVDLVDGPVTPTCAPASGSTFPLDATTTVTCSATDAHSNTGTATFTITVVDTTPPDVTVPADMTLEATGPAGAVATFSASAVDLVDGPVTPTCAPASGSTFPLGTTVVTCTATDAHSNSASATFNVTVQDTTPPDISNMPANMVLEATGPSGAVATWPPPTAVDLVDGTVPVVCAPASGSTFALDVTTTVTCTATDAHNNSASATFTVRVQDTTPPDISNMPANMTVSATGPDGAIVTWPPPTAVDLVDGSVPVVCAPPSGSQFPMGTTTVTCTATDAHNNASSRSFTVTVVDNTPPEVSVTLNPGILWPPNHKMVRIQVNVQTEPGAQCAIVSVTSNEPVEGRGDGNTPFDWIFSGLNLQLRAERRGPGSSRIYTVTVRCVDASNNEGFGTATAIVPHDMGNPAPGVKNR